MKRDQKQQMWFYRRRSKISRTDHWSISEKHNEKRGLIEINIQKATEAERNNDFYNKAMKMF